jgi:hypothetical protein
MGDDGSMTPDEASRFYEDDEDPEKIVVRFDAGPKSVTAAPTDARQLGASNVSIYVQVTRLYKELRRKALPEVSATGPRSYVTGRA